MLPSPKKTRDDVGLSYPLHRASIKFKYVDTRWYASVLRISYKQLILFFQRKERYIVEREIFDLASDVYG